MKSALLLALLLALLPTLARGSAPAAARLDLAPYQDPKGALTVHLGGNTVDPYFALRALLTASEAGLDVERPAQGFIAWMLPRQHADGRFARYCQANGAAWRICAAADADDALLAMWAQLLYLRAPCGKMPPAWRASAASALGHLDSLRDPVRGTYRIDRGHDTSLLMDNAEIYAALRSVAARQRCMGQVRAAARSAQRADQLAQAIRRVFEAGGDGAWRISTQSDTGNSFYPHHVAQVYPTLFGLTSGPTAHRHMQAWLFAHGAAWLSRSGESYPWGLVAIAAQAAGIAEPALEWLDRSAPLRHGAHWNILEDAAFQALCTRHRRQSVACSSLPQGPEPS